MKKYLIAGFSGLCLLVLCFSDAFPHGRDFRAPDHIVNFSPFIFHPVSVGYKHHVGRNVYLTGNLDYLRSEEDLIFQAGAAYMIPARFLFFTFYGGGGLEAARSRSHLVPYAMVGTQFWFFYSEVAYPLQSHEEPIYRFGFKISF